MHFSEASYHANKSFAALRRKNPRLFHHTKQTLEMERKEIFKKLALLRDSDYLSRRELERQMWVINGVLCHELDHDLLLKISAKYTKINMVPSNYLQPELFSL